MMVTSERVTVEEALERAFGRKRSNFIEDYELQERPALIWQAWPTEEVVVDVSSEKVRESMRAGGGTATGYAWWHGFKVSGWPTLVFDGLASTSEHNAAGWATEVHVDGHVAAAVWTFPEPRGSTTAGPYVAEFYVDAFRDFTYMACKVFEAAGAVGSVHLTATMHHADKLPFLADPGRWVAPASKRNVLRWPIATVGAEELLAAGSEMAARFMRIYGRRLAKS